jgi:hypothetical protein
VGYRLLKISVESYNVVSNESKYDAESEPSFRSSPNAFIFALVGLKRVLNDDYCWFFSRGIFNSLFLTIVLLHDKIGVTSFPTYLEYEYLPEKQNFSQG